MKRLVSAVLALTLLGTAAASAQSYRGGHGGYDSHATYSHGNYGRDYHNDYRGNYRNDNRGWNNNRGNGAAMIGLGIGLLSLAAIASSHDHYQSYGYYGR